MKLIHQNNSTFYPIQPQQVPPPPFNYYKQPEKPVLQTQQPVQQLLNHLNEEDGLQKFLTSEMSLQFQQIITYEQLLNQYDRVLTFDLQDQRLLMHQVLLIEIEMQPENMFWMYVFIDSDSGGTQTKSSNF